MALKDDYSTISEAAKNLGVTRQTVSRWIASGELPAERIGRETLIKREELFAFSFDKLQERLMKIVPIRLMDHLRKDYNLEKGDKLERFPDSFDFYLQRKDGTEWIAEFKGLHIGFDNSKAIVDYDKVEARPYKKRQRKKLGRK